MTEIVSLGCNSTYLLVVSEKQIKWKAHSFGLPATLHG